MGLALSVLLPLRDCRTYIGLPPLGTGARATRCDGTRTSARHCLSIGANQGWRIPSWFGCWWSENARHQLPQKTNDHCLERVAGFIEGEAHLCLGRGYDSAAIDNLLNQSTIIRLASELAARRSVHSPEKQADIHPVGSWRKLTDGSTAFTQSYMRWIK